VKFKFKNQKPIIKIFAVTPATPVQVHLLSVIIAALMRFTKLPDENKENLAIKLWI